MYEVMLIISIRHNLVITLRTKNLCYEPLFMMNMINRLHGNLDTVVLIIIIGSTFQNRRWIFVVAKCG